MNFLEIYINSLPIEVNMNFGNNKSVIMNSIDISPRLTRKGDPHSKNFFMEFLKVDENGKAYQREEFSFFKLRSDKLEFLSDNFFDQFNKMYHISKLLIEEDILEPLMISTMESLYKDNENHSDLITHMDSLISTESKTIPKKKLSGADLLGSVELLNKNLNEFWYTILKDVIGKDSPLLQLLTVVDNKGYKNLVDESKFIFEADADVKVSAKYLRRKEKSEAPIKADSIVSDTATNDAINLAALATDDEIYDIEDAEIEMD